MRNIVERIVIVNNGMEVRIAMFDLNGELVNDDTIRISMNLTDNDYTIDRETIAMMCNMSPEQFVEEYVNEDCHYQRQGLKCGADLMLAYAEFKRKAVVDDSVYLGNVVADSGSYVNKVMDELIANGGIYERCTIGEGTINDGSYYNCEFVELVANGGYYENCDIDHGGELNGGVYNNCKIIGVTYDADKCVFNDCVMKYCTEQKELQELYDRFQIELDKFTKDLKQVGTKSNKHTDEIVVESGAFAKVETEPVVIESEPVANEVSANPVVATIQELMIKALKEGDFDAYDKLEERLNRIIG